ncbi:hypothetical protein SS1G_05579 [Sclerotinia sclerotiorum 1980 UF-70]|uniref:Zn(2)-C6 fungal-type domain-containing protein n=2 Tax=Sclerotinia sclerotiorum (strain ATCC 18683 / 1980 / Ss-1) TaxID=665079 RepID=A0A1D9QAQ0_SCLS1|nr:hypothetical protein SS1G_05579 [Sclerotinia sclerotiorum 1980 UF-70]APA12007.1 hypothetical protein sscle_08g067770 [Sclerotinia sclerotiorum 1980 UF-70]EDO03100.1 hypothetical protein SS1G_05579 [Sclerotinia sclerotiorum 1980 UF-70]
MSGTSRHKSCLECIQTKRKCDRTWPRCQRCVARGSECQYIGRNRHQPQRSPDTNVDQSVPISERLGGQPSSNWELEQYHADPTSLLTPCWDGALFEFPNHFNLASHDNFIFNSIQDEVDQQASSSADPGIVRAITPDSKLQARVEFVAKRLATIPRTFAQYGHTMFIHRIQFQQSYSPALQDAMSACALYCMKSVANQALVVGNLEHKCQQLIASTDALLASKTDLLAALQALLLYQMMRLFDGDIRLRAHAEADEPIAILWASQLSALTYNAADTTLAAPDSTDTSVVTIGRKSDWQSWLLDESIRRTVITTFMLKGVYSFLKLGYDSPTDLHICFTAQAALWNAQSAIGWRRAQEETERLEIWVTRWDEAIAKAKPMDLEELGVLIMTMLWGPEATRTWLGEDVTLKYGLEMA